MFFCRAVPLRSPYTEMKRLEQFYEQHTLGFRLGSAVHSSRQLELFSHASMLKLLGLFWLWVNGRRDPDKA